VSWCHTCCGVWRSGRGGHQRNRRDDTDDCGTAAVEDIQFDFPGLTVNGDTVSASAAPAVTAAVQPAFSAVTRAGPNAIRSASASEREPLRSEAAGKFAAGSLGSRPTAASVVGDQRGAVPDTITPTSMPDRGRSGRGDRSHSIAQNSNEFSLVDFVKPDTHRAKGSGGGSKSSWACSACTFLNNGLLRSCEMCGTKK
jgi:hypothetical protein